MEPATLTAMAVAEVVDLAIDLILHSAAFTPTGNHIQFSNT
jgi:hypothetical protein